MSPGKEVKRLENPQLVDFIQLINMVVGWHG